MRMQLKGLLGPFELLEVLKLPAGLFSYLTFLLPDSGVWCTAIFPVTAAAMRAARRSFNRAVVCSAQARSLSSFVVSAAMWAAVACCSSSGGLHRHFDPERQVITPHATRGRGRIESVLSYVRHFGRVLPGVGQPRNWREQDSARDFKCEICNPKLPGPSLRLTRRSFRVSMDRTSPADPRAM